MDVGRRCRLYALHFELVAHLRLVDLDLGLTPSVGISRTWHLFFARQGCLEGGALGGHHGEAEISTTARTSAASRVALFIGLSTSSFGWGSSPHHIYTRFVRTG